MVEGFGSNSGLLLWQPTPRATFATTRHVVPETLTVPPWISVSRHTMVQSVDLKGVGVVWVRSHTSPKYVTKFRVRFVVAAM